MKITIIGQQCAGKTEAANILCKIIEKKEKLQTKILKFAQPLYEINTILQVMKHRAFMQEQSELVKKHFGQDTFINLFKKNNNDDATECALINDDCRYTLEFLWMIKHGWTTVHIDADKFLRKERAKKLGLDFLENHASETESPSLAKLCQWRFTNNGSLYKLSDKLSTIF